MVPRCTASPYTLTAHAVALLPTPHRTTPPHQPTPHCPSLYPQWLKPGLIANNVLEELDLTACALTDFAAMSVAAVLKVRTGRGWGQCSWCGPAGSGANRGKCKRAQPTYGEQVWRRR